MDIAKIEDRIDRVATSGMAVSDQLGGIRFTNMVEVMELAKMLSISKEAVPKHLRGEPGVCLAICLQAVEWRFSPYSVANKSYVVNDRLCYESQLYHAVIEQRAPIKGRLRHRYEGEGDERVCVVWGVPKNETEPLEYRSPPIGKITPKNSPLWRSKPDYQLYLNTCRDWCRAYYPDIILGVFSKDELEDSEIGPDNARDITPKPDIASRLKGATGRGFSQSHVEAQTALEHKPGEVVPEAKKEPEAVVITDEAVLEKAGIVHLDPYTSPPAGPVPAGEPTKVVDDPPPKKRAKSSKPPESPLDRARRLLPMCRTREDVDNVLHSIGEELVDEAGRAALKELGDARSKEL